MFLCTFLSVSFAGRAFRVAGVLRQHFDNLLLLLLLLILLLLLKTSTVHLSPNRQQLFQHLALCHDWLQISSCHLELCNATFRASLNKTIRNKKSKPPNQMYVYGGKIASTNRITTIPMSMSFMRMREYWPLSAAVYTTFEPTLFYGICI